MTSSETPTVLEAFAAVRRRWRLVLGVVALATVTAVGLSLTQEKQYDATVQLLLRGEEPITQTLRDPGFTPNDPERTLNTEVALIEVGGTAHDARRRLGISRSPDELLEQIDTKTQATSNIVELRARDRDPRLAADIANAFAEAFVQYKVRSARARFQEAADLAQQQLLGLSPDERRSTPEGLELQARARELAVAAALQTGGAEIVRRASVPTSPSRPRPLLSGVAGALLGLLLGCAAVLLLELFDRRFKDEQAVEDFFGVPLLVAVPTLPRRANARDEHAVREAYGLLAANIRFSWRSGGARVVLVTSPSPSDGKTSVTVGLARALARLGQRVLALEADLRRPSFGRHVGVADSRGLAAVVRGEAELRDEVLWYQAGSLEVSANGNADGVFGVLPAGESTGESPQALLAQPEARALVDRARALADVVLVDSPPIGTVNDAALLARGVDSVILVVKLGSTTKDAARRAMRVLAGLGVEIAGVVVTDAGSGARYGYYGPAGPEGRPALERAGHG